jgi:protein O-GlcNAc transferase
VVLPDSQEFQRALNHHQSGRLADAESLYRQIIAQAPQFADAWHMFGLLCHQLGRGDEAVASIRQAIAIDPAQPAFHANLGSILAQQGRKHEAIDSFRQALALRPAHAPTLYQLGSALLASGQFEEAAAQAKEAVRLQPDFVQAYVVLGDSLFAQDRLAEAIVALQQALSLQPNLVEARNNLGTALYESGRVVEAVDAYRQALSLRPDSVEIQNNLAGALDSIGRYDEAVAIYRGVLERQPDSLETGRRLAVALKGAGEIEGAARHLELAAAQPDPAIGSELLVLRHSQLEFNRQRLFEEHVRWSKRFAEPLMASVQPHDDGCSPQLTSRNSAESRLRIGYFAHYLGDQPTGRFLLPILREHDRRGFEVYCYCDSARPDAVTRRLMQSTDCWRSTKGLSDEAMARLVREDQVDILVDLTLHFPGNRMLAFARKPAPVQVMYLAFCSTSGLRTMDYRLTDRFFDPPEWGDQFYTEKSVHLTSYWCYEPPDVAGEVAPLPATQNGCITFGCLNGSYKLTSAVLSAWAELLRAVPRSRLMLHSKSEGHRQKILRTFAAEGIDSSRVGFVQPLPLDQYFEKYHSFDLVLDTFPYTGGTTSCDALWMGVPVVTLAGETGVSRGGLSILSTIGLPELAANSVGQYVRIAADLAADVPRLANLRSTMRQRMRNSSLMDAAGFVRGIETAYRWMWRQWYAACSD